jgi:23S rRNA (guanosine2251-2'-O)-methyltransferase
VPAPAGPRGHVIYGRNPVHEALRAKRRRVHRVWAVEGAAREPWLRGVRVDVVDGEEVAERSGSDAHQGIVAAVEAYPYANAADLLAFADPFLVVLDEVQDPQNLGAIARSAECAGAHGLIIPDRRSAEVTAAAAKASAGAVEHLPIARVRNVADFLAEARDAGCWSYGAAGEASTRFDQPDYRGGVILVLGSEGRGLRPRVAKACDTLVSLPLRGRIDSLNVSAAGAILLYEIAQSRDFA